MGRNNQRRKTNIEQRNFKLYKHKKQWMTACATFLLTFGATAVMNVSASANTDNISNGNSTPKNAEVVKAALTNEEQSNNAQQVNEMPADSKKQTATASTVDQSTAKQTTAVKDRQEQTVATQPSESVNSSKVTFEFVDQYNNNAVVGQTYSQEFIPGAQTNLNFNMTIPTDPEGYGYELANGTSIPSQYTLPAYTQTPVVVQVPIHQKMHFNIRFHDEDSNTDLGTVDISGFTAGNGGYDPNAAAHLKLPKGASVGNYYSVSTSGVPKGVTLMGSSWTPLTNPDATWYIPNYKWEKTEAVEKALTGTTMTINLKHKINTTQEQQTRTATVNYVKAKVNADGTYTQDGNVTQSAVLDVCYSRNKYEDQVTKKITYSPWLWDTNQGQNGYHVVSGKWTSLPTSWEQLWRMSQL